MMSGFFRRTAKVQRIIGVLIAGAVFLLLQITTAIQISSSSLVRGSSAPWIFFASYALISLLFYCIGSFCWLYAYGKQHVVTTLLFLFTTQMMIVFSTISLSFIESGTLIAIGGVCIVLSDLTLFALLLHFPYPLLKTLGKKPKLLLYLFSFIVIILACLTSIREVYVYGLQKQVSDWLNLSGLIYFLVLGIAIISVVILSFRSPATIREKQQSRFFLLGTLLSFVPIFGLTVVPTILRLRFVVAGNISMFFLVLFPLTMGYAVLRYNLMVFDSYVKRVVTVVVGVVGLALLAFFLFTVGNVFVSNTISLNLAIILLLGVVGAPCIWWGCKLLTERAFFPEARYYKQVLKQIKQNQLEQSFDLQQTTHLLVIDAMTTLSAPGACAFVLNEETNTYVLSDAPEHEAERIERMRVSLLTQVADYLSTSPSKETFINGNTILIQQLYATDRPLFWSEVVQAKVSDSEQQASSYLPFVPAKKERSGPLLAPMRSSQGVLIGIVVVSERGDEQSYGGPDLEALVQLLQFSALPLETARQFQVTMRQQEKTALEREEAYEKQRQLNEMKEQLIIHMSHELRTPLAEVSGYLELMNDFGDALDPEMRTLFIQKATHGCDELLQLLSTILAAAQSNAVETPANLTNVELTSLIQEEIEHLDPLQAQEHTIIVQQQEQLYVSADKQSLHQVVRNLLSNALKYSPPQTRVTVSISEKANKTLLCVKDEGPGITANEMSLLFGKFVRLPRHHSGSIRGTGLGLYISKQMIEAMHGRIWAESSGIEGEGTAFFVQLVRGTKPQENANSNDVDSMRTPASILS